jgi:hypothetical protein
MTLSSRHGLSSGLVDGVVAEHRPQDVESAGYVPAAFVAAPSDSAASLFLT